MASERSKNFFESKTNWIGIITFAVSVLTYLQGQEWIQQYPEVVSAIGAALGVLTVIVRLFTSRSVAGPIDSVKRLAE